MDHDASQVRHEPSDMDLDVATHRDDNQDDPDSLFIPERDPAPHLTFDQFLTSNDMVASEHTPGPSSTPAPALAPSPVPAPKPRSTVDASTLKSRILSFNKKAGDKKLMRRQTEPAQANTNPHGRQHALDEDDRADKNAAEEFEKKKRYYDELRQRHGGGLPFIHDVEWTRIQSRETARQQKRARDMAKAQEGDNDDAEMFTPLQSMQTSEEQEEVLSDTDFLQSRPHKNISMQDVELRSMRVALEAQNDDPSKKRKKKEKKDKEPGARTKPKTATKRKSTAPKKVTKSSSVNNTRQSKKKQKKMDDAARQASSLLYSNVFSQQADPDAAEQPFFSSTSKKQAMKDMIASVPAADEKEAKSDISSLLKATRSFSRGAVKPDAKSTNLWSVRGMKTSLKAYQVFGSAFMRDRENAAEEPRGGLLADQMGLGKTLMTLANIHDGRPPKNSTGPKTTLIVASPALLTQWKSEIEQHSTTKLTILRYGVGNRIDSNASVEILRGHDIVLATYTEVMRSHPKNEPPSYCETEKEKEDWWEETFEQHRGALHRVHFLRIVLDEAQAIKNHMSRTSIACRALIADHKWALSGTPILNSLAELYPYFKFIGVPYTGTFEAFKEFYCKNVPRLMVRLSQFMLRRTHADTIFGAPILKLPQASQMTFWCEFNPVERSIYDIVHERFIERIRKYMSNKTLNKSYNNILVMLLRLRQLTAHILMLQFVIRDLLERRDIERIKEVVERQAADSNTQSKSGKTIIAIRRQLEKLAEDESQKNKRPEDLEVNDEDDIDEQDAESAHRFEAGGKFGKGYDFKPFLNSLQTGESWRKAKREAKCGACGRHPELPMLTSCGHLICNSCYSDACIESAEQGEENPACKVCHSIPEYVQPCELDDFDVLDTPAFGTRSNAGKKKDKELKRLGREDIAHDWLASVGDDVLPSAKTIAVKSQIMNWLKENPEVKIIVYTQFLAMVRILGRVCQNEGWKAVEYHGKLSLPARDNAIRAFAKDQNIRILLASLRCGGLGLNLTMASKVIVIDPWWNSATEQQAFCRVFRIGQDQETSMSRLCVRGTVDEKLIEMQERKEEEIKKVMEEGGRPVEGMDTHKLMELFGVFGDNDGSTAEDLEYDGDEP